jgi:hypothetical protein
MKAVQARCPQIALPVWHPGGASSRSHRNMSEDATRKRRALEGIRGCVRRAAVGRMRIPMISDTDSGTTAPVFPSQTRCRFRSGFATHFPCRGSPTYYAELSTEAGGLRLRRTLDCYGGQLVFSVQDIFTAAFAGAASIESGAIDVSTVPLSRPWRGGSLRLDPAISRPSQRNHRSV